jgi:hypothetical protein
MAVVRIISSAWNCMVRIVSSNAWDGCGKNNKRCLGWLWQELLAVPWMSVVRIISSNAWAGGGKNC